MLSVGIPKEIKANEKRVGLTPEASRHLTSQGIPIYVEQGAGALSGFADAAYEEAGAKILNSADDVYTKADIIQKVKEPLAAEFPLLSSKHILFCFLHLASHENAALLAALVKQKVTSIGFEAVEENGTLPILTPMSQIAGALGAAYGLYFSESQLVFGDEIVYPGNLNVELGNFAKAYPEAYRTISGKKMLIFGGGVAGASAYQMAERMQSEALIVEKCEERQSHLKGSGLKVIGPEDLSESLLRRSHVFVGAAHTRGQRAVKVLDEASLKACGAECPKVWIDIAIDQGGNFPGSHSTSYEDPLYLDSDRHLRFAVPNLPAMSGGTASIALAKETVRFTELLATCGPQAVEDFKALRKGLNTREGKILLSEVSQAHPGVS